VRKNQQNSPTDMLNQRAVLQARTSTLLAGAAAALAHAVAA